MSAGAGDDKGGFGFSGNADVAGGKGSLAFELALYRHLETTVIDTTHDCGVIRVTYDALHTWLSCMCVSIHACVCCVVSAIVSLCMHGSCG